MLFADEGFVTWANALIGVLLAAGTAIVAAISAGITWMATNIKANANLLKRIDDLTTASFAQNDKIFALQESEKHCLQREADWKLELTSALRRISHLEKGVGMGTGDPCVGIVVSDLKGIIHEYSPGLTPLLGWLRDEIIGRPITVLMPPEAMQRHTKAFKLFTADEDQEADSNKMIFENALAKSGALVPVIITLRTWPAGDRNLITATIKERQQSSLPLTGDAIPIPANLPKVS